MDFLNADLQTIFIRVLIVGIAVFLAAKILPGISISGFWNSFLVALLVGVLDGVFTWVFNYFHWNELNNLISNGIFKFVFIAAVLMIVDKILEGFEIENFFYALLASFVITLIVEGISWLLSTKLGLI